MRTHQSAAGDPTCVGHVCAEREYPRDARWRLTGRSWLSTCRGFSVIEVTTTFTLLAVLSGVAAPAFDGYIEDAKLVRAHHDVATLTVSLVRLFNDVGGERGIAHGWATYDLLIGAGAVADADGPAYGSG